MSASFNNSTDRALTARQGCTVRLAADGVIEFVGTPEEKFDFEHRVAAFFEANPEVRLTPEEFIEKFGTPTVERTQPPRREDVQ